ncbi:hypothetical protein Droror1_Dr00019338 [Drosera rotundifolia]
MGGVLKGNNGNGNGGGNGNHKGRPYALMILLAFGAAFSAIMVLHKFRERRVIDMISAEKDQQLIAIHSLLQTSQLLHEKVKKKILHIKERHRIERKELLSTISALKEEREKLYMELEEKNSEIKTLREHEANSGKESSQAAALEEILKQKEAEIEHLKNQIETLARVRSLSTDDPSNPSKTHSGVLEQNMDASQSTEDDHSANLTDNNVAFETVHLVEKIVSKEEPNPLESVNEPSIRESDAREERNIDENQRKDSTESQGERDSALAQEDLTKAQKTSNGALKAPAFNSQQEGQGIENVQRGELNPERRDSKERISHTRRHRRHRIKRLKEYLRNRQLGTQEQTEAAEKQISTDTVESQQNNTVGSVVEKSNVIEEHVEESVTKNEARGQVEQLPPSDEQSKIIENQSQEGVAEKAQETDTIANISSMKLQETQKSDDKNDAGRQNEQLPKSNDQSKETENQNGQSLAEKAHETEKFENITSMKQQETQKSEKVMDQINTVGTEQKEIPNTEQAVVNTEKESVEVSLSINDKKQNSSDESKHIEEEEQQRNQATPESKDSDNKENTIKQVTEREELEDEEEAENGSSDLDTVTENSSIDSKPKQAEETKEDVEEEETEF